MAVYAAHLTRTLQGTPSVFQVTAQDALGATVKPALRKLVEYVAATHPSKCGWCERWFDELYLLLDCCLQYHYLKHYAASFSESFYGLLRVPLSVSREFSLGQRLPPAAERGSLLLLVAVPYLRDKVDRFVDQWRQDLEDGRLGKRGTDGLRRAAVRVYSAVHVAWCAARLVQLARYVRGGARAHAPELAALGLGLRDAPPRHQDDHSWTDLGRALLTGRIGSAVVTFPMWCGALLRAAEYGAFLVQFLRWWEARGAQPLARLPPPPPPQRGQCAARSRNRCPLCWQRWRTPTVLPVSGYIFCYVCISRHVRRHAACPVTRCPATERSLVRLYVD